MYLKGIEISGFKSFADKIDINLDNKITCIVGPNGSGKSNIVDAIRFVLGEQSVKSLRGDSLMADVIFAGSKNRSPMHAASVSLTFDNQDNYLKIPYNTVSIKRRLYKTGDNEYFLNGEKCRLKDIVDLLLDSGMGRDSFNIISQGDISKLLSNSPYERRLVIEEAAGILKYKKRREEAFKKLDKTNLNLERINDIISEVETRVNPLKEQSEKASLYLNLKDKLSKTEISLLVSEITSLNQNYLQIKEKIKNLNEIIISLNTKVNDPLIDELKIKSLNIEKNLQKLNQDLILKAKEKEEINSKKLILEEKIKYQTTNLENQDKLNYLTNQKYSFEKELMILKEDLSSLKKDKENLDLNLNNLLDKINDLRNKLETNQKEFNLKNKDYLTLVNQIEILKSNLEENSYLSFNVKKVLEKGFFGLYDALINLVKTSKEYQRCLEIATLSNKNFLVVENSDVAKRIITYLKENNLGRITFLPLDVIKPKEVDNYTKKLLNNQSGYLGVLTDFLEYDSIYQDVISNQFGNILVVKTLEDANTISKLINNKYRIITLDGDIIHVGGSITGGSYNIKSINSLKNQILDLETKVLLTKDILNNLGEVGKDLEENINILNQEIYKKRSKLISLIDNIGVINNNLKLKQEDLENINLELRAFNKDTLNQELDELKAKYYHKSLEYDLIFKNINNFQKEKDELQKDILEKEGINKVNNQILKEREKELNNLEILINKIETKLDNNLNILNEEYSLTYERAKEEYILEGPLEEAKEEVILYKTKLKEIGNVNLDSIKEYETVKERYEFLTSERDDLLHAKEMLYTLIDEMDDVMKTEFINTFKELEVEFKKVFKNLFKGGDASLKLTDPNNLMETGVDIIASPPGKKLKTITLLSGGEKTLTAISLLFAILNIRSVPFCIFDEVEAALDEANVDNFGSYLHSYKDKTQFLLITHKKRTMEYANNLYGITMQESGVSKLVSVKLENQEN